MNDKNFEILEEGQEITIENTETITNITSSPTDNDHHGRSEISAELSELNQLFQELESMIAEKKNQPVVPQVVSEVLQQKRHQAISSSRESIQTVNGESFANFEHLPEDDSEEFAMSLEQFCQLPSRIRLINQLKTCQPQEGAKEYTTVSEYGNYYKTKLAIGLADTIQEGGIAHAPTMYIASGHDLEFPLLLQSRHIIMVDPCFQNHDEVNKMVAKINQYDSYDPDITQISSYHYNIKFRFNFGGDLEIVNLDLFGKKYQEYRNFLPLGTIIEYNSSLKHTLTKPDLLAKLMRNGIIINNQPSPLRELHLGWLNRFSRTVDPDKIEDQNAQHLGLKTIRLPFIPFAIYQKQESNQKLVNYAESLG